MIDKAKAIEPEYPEYDIINPDGTVEKAEQGEDDGLKRNARGYVVDEPRQVPYYPSSTAGTLKYQRIPMCGHKFIPQTEPRHRNCEGCWFTFFQVHGELTQSVEEVHAKHGGGLIRTLKGPKFLKNFLKFMSTVANFKATLEAKKETDVNSTGPTEGSNEAVSS